MSDMKVYLYLFISSMLVGSFKYRRGLIGISNLCSILSVLIYSLLISCGRTIEWKRVRESIVLLQVGVEKCIYIFREVVDQDRG